MPLPDGLRPEGITSVGTRYYVGSLADGRIVTGDLRRGGSTVLLPGATGRQVRGLAVDRRSGLLWAVGNVGAVAHVWAVRTRDGRVVADRVVPGGVFLNDLLVTRGAVWVTDSGVDRLTAVPLGRGGRPTTSALRYLPLRGAWPSVAEGNRANGIEWLSKGHVVLDHSTAGGLWDVSLRTGGARRIAVTGGPAIVGGDGLERAGRTLFVVRGTDDASVAQASAAAPPWRLERALPDAPYRPAARRPLDRDLRPRRALRGERPLRRRLAGDREPTRSPGCASGADERAGQHADALDLDVDPRPVVHLADAGRGAGDDHVAGQQRERLRHVPPGSARRGSSATSGRSGRPRRRGA
ncbi:hypothetical protein GCM10025868_40090 [Angustibacter aerolatus]|uniref:SMP-30/Gluconolactonase/LRE-like region domain-containing protein n=1 Tax=Angustibacter aerolatus TaxID=1162965 RepID=A0ABQ6JNR1_9ACTN|nr:hypothetical protein GCM10025868_40090 [Angustibacter aerolatus]